MFNNIYPKTKDGNVDDKSSSRSHEDSDKSDIDWTAKESFEFHCTILFNYLGKYDRFLRTIYDLRKSTPRVLGSRTFDSLFENEKFADFTFIVRDKKFKVHKCLLSEASETLELLFTCGTNETVATIDCDPEVFKYFLKFIYTGSWPVDEMRSICMDLYELAYRYEIKALIKICIAFIMNKKVDQDNALKFYEFALTYKNSELLESSWKFIKNDMLSIECECDPKSLEQVMSFLEEKKKFEERLKSFIAENPSTPEPVLKRQRISQE